MGRLLRITDGLSRLWLRLRGFRLRWVSTSHGRVALLDAQGRGESPPILVIHGISASSVQLAPVLLGLRAHARRVLAVDLPGHGLSDDPGGTAQLREGLVEALDQALDEPAVVYGNSLGGVAALAYTRQRPEQVLGLLLNSPGGAPMEPEPLREFLGRFVIPDHAAAMVFARRIYARMPWYAAVAGLIVRESFANPFVVRLLEQVEPDDLVTPEELRALPMPVLLLWGQDDDLMPYENHQFYLEHLPGHAVVREPEGMGHCPYLDTPDALTQHIAEFARAVGEGRAPARRVS